ncbi:MAG: rhodanese-like domain-containing protein [Thermodesulfovibrionales bacterium]|nr:rhodanese-like domain-containing protein [Thermodesulfovibrionales bacterium]
MKKAFMVATICCLIGVIGMVFTLSAFAQEKPTITRTCAQCHKAEKDVLRGTVGVISAKAETIQMTAGAVWVVKFDDNTKIVGWGQPINKLPRDKEIAVKVVKKDADLYATEISVKQPAKLPPEKIASTEFVAEHVEKGDAVIIDSRPAPRFYEGAIPGAINIYDAEFDKHIDKLPKDKNQLLIFYCMGPT